MNVNGEWIVRRVRQNKFTEFKEAGKSKASLAKYSVQFNEFPKEKFLTVFGDVRQTVYVTICEKIWLQTTNRFSIRLLTFYSLKILC